MLRLKGFCLKLEHYHFSIAKCFQPTKIKFCFLKLLPFHMHVWENICRWNSYKTDTTSRNTRIGSFCVPNKTNCRNQWGADACWAAAAACLQAGHGRKFTKGHAGYYIYIYKCRWSDPRNCLGTPSMCNCHGQPDISLY